ncbi:class I adenylate-forming enzyme family protein [Microbacterium indicum]|uniref:class I adenylate-forming enzyme family protein n=1 Tax=Microbacterium indicum TaxID=358100 RepID=UPI00041A687B|nr:AMP-binding protein [Microbacterium indicum]
MTETDTGSENPTNAASPYDQSGRYDAAALREVFEQHLTYLAGVERNVHRYAHRTALSDPATGGSWTYAQLGEDVRRIAGGLFRRGVRARQLVMVELPNSPEFALLYPAANTLRGIFSPTNFRLAPGEVAYLVEEARPAVLVYDTDRTADLAQALASVALRPHLLVAVGDGERIPGSVGWDDIAGGEPIAAAELEELGAGLPPASVYDETTRLYTSGTTGLPKAVPLPSLVDLMSAHDVIMHFPLSPFDKTLNMTPLFHRGGLYSGGPNPVFYVGAENVTLRSFDPDVVLDLVESEKLTYLIGAPATLYRLADAQERRPRDVSALKGIVTMGAPLDRAAALRFQRVLTPRIFNGYGTSETFWNTVLRPEDLPDGAGSTGRASTDDDVAVARAHPDRLGDPSDTVPRDGQTIGEFATRSVKAGYSYLGNAAAEAGKIRDGWFFPGDLATWDEDEIVTIVGRKDDMIISGGENVHPVQVEAALAEHPAVADSIVVGVPDDEWGQVVAAYVVRRSGGELPDDDAAAAEFDAFLRDHPGIARYKRPRLYRFVDGSDIPFNATGKKLHYRKQEQAAADAASGLFLAR